MKTTDKFTGKADIYSKYRPNYPMAYINYLISYNSLTSQSLIADIGSGTGILSKQLLNKNLRVLAVEPNKDMRAQAEQLLADYDKFTSINGTAEATTLQEKSIDLITVAQAFHWFDKDKFKLECKRILKPASNVALVWNSRDLSNEIIQENAKICMELCPSFKGFSGGIEETPEIYKLFFKEGIYEYMTFENNLEFGLNDFIGRNLSASFAPKETEKNYNRFIDALKNLFAKYGKSDRLILPHITRSYIGKI